MDSQRALLQVANSLIAGKLKEMQLYSHEIFLVYLRARLTE